jgi:hypothetical protein
MNVSKEYHIPHITNHKTQTTAAVDTTRMDEDRNTESWVDQVNLPYDTARSGGRRTEKNDGWESVVVNYVNKL